jgi:cytoskeletal protein CcmA (bactofilin family)
MKRKTIWLGMLALLLLWPAAVALADQPTWQFDGGQIFDENVSLQPGQIFDGDLGIFSGDLDMPVDSTVNGDVFVANGDAQIAGRVNGNLAVIDGKLDLVDTGWVSGDVFSLGGEQTIAGQVRGNLSAVFGNMVLRSTAIVEGDLLVAPGSVVREAGAQVLGEQVQGGTVPRIPPIPTIPSMPPIPALPAIPQAPHVNTFGSHFGHWVGRIFSAGFLSLLLIALGLVVVIVWPRATHKVSACITAIPVQSFGLGLLTFLIAAGLEALAAVLMVIIILVAAALIGTVILIPVGLLLILLSVLVLLPVPVALAGAMVLGWVSLAELIGQRVLTVLKVRDVKPLGTTLVGLLVTVSVTAMFWVLKPVCCAWPFAILVSSVGLGAVVHTRFGRENCLTPTAPEPVVTGPVITGDPLAGDQALPAEAMDDETGQPDVPPVP